MSRVTVFLDTNGFIQFFDLNQLQWPELFPKAEEISVMVSSVVIEELDKHKSSTNQRRRDRARAALRLIEEASLSEGMSLEVRAANPKVNLTIFRGPAPKWSEIDTLDMSQPDDRLVADALSHGNGAAVLTNDAGPRIRARLVDVQAYAPPESWLLPAEKTDDQVKIKNLTKELADARNARPKLALTLGQDGERGELVFDSISLPALSAEQVANLTELKLARSPKVELANPPQLATDMLFYRRMAYDERDIERYERDYESYPAHVEQFFRDLHSKIGSRGMLNFVPYLIKNTGDISARNLRCEVAIDGDFIFLRDRKAGRDWVASLLPPTPPKKPDLKNIGIGGWSEELERNLMQDFRPPHLATAGRPNDPTEMHRFSGPDHSGEAFGCNDFRPDRTFADEICLYGGGDGSAKGEITIEVNAEHHPTIVSRLSISEQIVTMAWPDIKECDYIPAELKSLLLEAGIIN